MAAESPGRRALIVGCGRIAGGFNESDETAVLTHVVAYRRAGAPVVGCVDADGEAAARFARRWNVPVAGRDIETILDQAQPDVVSLCTPPDVRLEALRRLLRAPSVRAVLVEKPLALGVRDAEEIAALAAATGRAVLVNYFRAFDPFYVEIERAVRAGERGRLGLGTALYYGDAVTNASHLVERLLAMFGAPSSVRRTGGEARRPAFEVAWGAARVTFLPVTGCRYSPVELDLLFESERLRIVDSECRAERFEAQPDPTYPEFLNLVPARMPSPAVPSREALLAAVTAALDAAANGPGPRERRLLNDAVEVVRLLAAVADDRG
jgi:hypothetical protein